MIDTIALGNTSEYSLTILSKDIISKIMNAFLLPGKNQEFSVIAPYQASPSRAVAPQIITPVSDSMFYEINCIIAPKGYPVIENIAKNITKTIFSYISSSFYLLPTRISPSVEGGLALVYQKPQKKLFRSKRREVFIEIYNDGSFVMTLLNNLDIVKIEEVDNYDETIIHQYIEAFLLD